MPVHYSAPFKLFSVRHPASGERWQVSDEKQARSKAEEIARETKSRVDEVLSESRCYYVREYRSGAKGGRRVNTGEETKYGASQWAVRRVRDGRGPALSGRKVLKDAIAEWLGELEVRGLREKSLLDYRVQTSFWASHFPDRSVADVTAAALLDFFRNRRALLGKKKEGERKTRKPSPRLLNVNLRLWRAFSRWAMARGYLDADPTAELRPWREPKKEPRVLSPEEVQKLLEACRKPFEVDTSRPGAYGYTASATYAPPLYLEAAVTLALTSALRLANVLGLRWGEVDLKRGEIRIPPERVKTGQELVIPISKSFLSLLLALPKGGEPAAPVLGVAEIDKAFRAAVKRAGLRDVTFHALRRTAATTCLRAGVGFEVVRRLGGWSAGNDVVLKHYRAIGREELDRAVAVLDALVRGVPVAQNSAQVS